MARTICIVIGDREVKATLNESKTAGAIHKLLPLDVSMTRWGDEYYGDCGLSAPLESDARAEMEVRKRMARGAQLLREHGGGGAEAEPARRLAGPGELADICARIKRIMG